MSLIPNKKPARLLPILIWLTLIAITSQIIFFLIHYKVSDLLDSLVQSSLKSDMLHAVILLPLIQFFLIQFISYSALIAWVWFITTAISELFRLPQRAIFWLGLFIWFTSCCAILSLNNYFFPDSFFAILIPIHNSVMIISIAIALITALVAYIYSFWSKQHRIIGSVFLVFSVLLISFQINDYFKSRSLSTESVATTQPHIILIGLDSVRPDYVSSLNPQAIATPHIDRFLKNSTLFTEAYTPLARTFTSWMSILTAQYPKHSNARSNLADPDRIRASETLAKRLQAAGYETIYATDEKRFSNITERYGFDRLVGPSMGVNDFILGGLGDFPLTNLLINSSLGRILFPFNYANRAAAITYEPDTFLRLVKLSLAHRAQKPLFLSIHLCISHWPYTWARDKQAVNATLADRYQSSVTAVDRQLGDLMQILKENHLLDHSLVVLLSDHGTTLGLPNDRIIVENKYVGNHAEIKPIQVFKLGSAPAFTQNFKRDYRLDTSYGQGTDVLSLKQYHVLFAFKGFGIANQARQIKSPSSLLDIAPTILEFLKLPPLEKSDGVSLKSYLFDANPLPLTARALFIESGHTITEIQTNDIFIDKVVKNAIGIYQIDPRTGLLFIKPEAEQSITRSKQRAILLGDWLLARYPASTRSKLATSHTKKIDFQTYTSPAFFVLTNLKTGKWSVGLQSSLAKEAPLNELLQKFNSFYGDEL